MNSLEFIEKTIQTFKYQIEYTKIQIKFGNLSEQVGNQSLNEDNEILNHFQQIKTELEAWEVVKDKITTIGYYDTVEDYEEDINEHKALCLVSNLKFQNSNDEDEWFIPLTEKETYKIKKALEVKDE